MGQTTGSPQSSVDRLILEQRRYYDLRADDYADLTRPSDRAKRGVLGGALAEALVEELRPSGTVLELAAGSGAFTRLLADRAAALTVVDGSERMLELNRRLVARDDVEYVHADLFEWRPARRYDIVFFGFWLSHVPPTHFRRFWDLVRS